MDNEHEVDPADFTWPATEIAEVTGVTVTNTETGEEIDLEPADRHAQTGEVILAWDGEGIWRLEP